MEPPFFSEPHSAGKLRFNVRSMAAWAPGAAVANEASDWLAHALPPDDGSAPELGFVPPMLRRRLNRSARMGLHVAHRAIAGLIGIPTVFASRHGELHRTAELLHALAAGELPSPASFSLSVHNAAAGIFSIARNDQAPASSIAAGDETLLWAIQEATLRLERGAIEHVLVVYADDCLPNEYKGFREHQDCSFALALLLSAGDEFELAWHERGDLERSPDALPRALATWIASKNASITWIGERLSLKGLAHA